ncbi:MAG: transposase [Candidatus Brocadiales bacterium]
MLGRTNKQCSFGDLRSFARVKESHFLLRIVRIDREINWRGILSRLESLYDPRMGRPSFPPLMMLKVLLLEQWYNLSDPEAEEALMDRLSLQRFLGLSTADPVPDETTICRFRSELIKNSVLLPIFQDKFMVFQR